MGELFYFWCRSWERVCTNSVTLVKHSSHLFSHRGRLTAGQLRARARKSPLCLRTHTCLGQHSVYCVVRSCVVVIGFLCLKYKGFSRPSWNDGERSTITDIHALLVQVGCAGAVQIVGAEEQILPRSLSPCHCADYWGIWADVQTSDRFGSSKENIPESAV